jgi:hypothetical protein
MFQSASSNGHNMSLEGIVPAVYSAQPVSLTVLIHGWLCNSGINLFQYEIFCIVYTW